MLMDARPVQIFEAVATGVWTNPNPRSLTDPEKARFKAIQTEAQKLRAQLYELDKESNVLHRIQQPQIKVRYRFGKPPHLSNGGIFDFGECPMELENGEFHFQMEPPIQNTHGVTTFMSGQVRNLPRHIHIIKGVIMRRLFLSFSSVPPLLLPCLHSSTRSTRQAYRGNHF